MTFKHLVNFGGPPDTPAILPVDRYHSSSHHYDHGWSKGHGSGGGNNKGALSALTLLAFLFLLNVMQQCLQENNATETTTTTAIFLREGQQPISLVPDDNGAFAESRDSLKNTIKEDSRENI